MKDLPSEEFLQEIRPRGGEENWENNEHYANRLMFYLFANQFVSGKEVLDAACGYGYGSYILAQSAKHVIGVDLGRTCIKYAVNHYSAHNIEYHQMDVTNIAFVDNRFNVVISIETMEHLPPELTDKFLDELKRVLEPGGLLVLSTPNRTATANLEKPMSGHINEKTVAELRTLINSKFVNGRFYYFLRACERAEKRSPSCSASSTVCRQGIRFLRRVALRSSSLIKGRVLGRHPRPILPILQRKQICPMVTLDDEKYGSFQFVVAHKPKN